jgi:hypothetical protein
MKKTIIAASIAALFASSALPTIAGSTALDLNADTGLSLESDLLTAQTDVGVDAGVDGSLDASEDGVAVDAGANVDANANANASGDAADDTFGSVIASLNSDIALDLSAVTEESDITVIALSSLQGNADTESAALDTALSAEAEAHAALHNQVEANAAIKAKLEAEGFAVEDVVSIKSKADGSVIVYVDDRA